MEWLRCDFLLIAVRVVRKMVRNVPLTTKCSSLRNMFSHLVRGDIMGGFQHHKPHLELSLNNTWNMFSKHCRGSKTQKALFHHGRKFVLSSSIFSFWLIVIAGTIRSLFFLSCLYFRLYSQQKSEILFCKRSDGCKVCIRGLSVHYKSSIHLWWFKTG